MGSIAQPLAISSNLKNEYLFWSHEEKILKKKVTMFKTCSKCGKSKPASEFYKNRRSKDGLYSYCKVCHQGYVRNYIETPLGKEKWLSAIKRGIKKNQESGYYRFGPGAIPILRQGAKKRGLEFNLTVESLGMWWNNTPDICEYCGITTEEYRNIRDRLLNYQGINPIIKAFSRLFVSRKHKGINWLTIDRKDNLSGYTIDNICKSCWFCNKIKGEFLSHKEMKMIAGSIHYRLKKELEREK